MLESFNSQFAHPRGFMGSLVGTIMAVENRERIHWAVSVLNAQPGDHILEIGFGPGVAVQQLARVVTSGAIEGIDASEVMVQQARERNKTAIQAGKVHLQLGTAEALPYADGMFDIAFAINSLPHWRDAAAGLQEMRRVLKPGGRIAIFQQPISAADSNANHIQALVESISAQLQAAGFNVIRFGSRVMRPAPTICVLGAK